MIPIAASDEITLDFMDLPVLGVGHAGLLAIEIMQMDVFGIVDRYGATRRAGLHEIARNLRLPVDHDPASQQIVKVDALHVAVKGQFDAVMGNALGVHTRADADLTEEVDRTLLEHPGTDATQHIVGAFALDDDRIDTCLFQQSSQSEARRASANNRNLSAHRSSKPALCRVSILLGGWWGGVQLPMDKHNIELDYSNMNAIPTYALYGEDDSASASWFHWETITSRSKLYGFRISAHRHDQLHQILYLERGEARVMIDGKTIDVAPPALVIVPPMAVHSFVFSSDVSGFVLTFYAQDVRAALADIGREANGLMEARIISPLDGVVAANELDHVVRRLVAEADRAAPGQVAALKARLTLLLIAAHRLERAAARESQESQQVSERHARAFLDLVDKHYRDTRKIAFYASKLGITPTHLNRVCRQVLGNSALGVIERRILVEARRYLQFSTLSVKEIGILLGYPDPAYFSRFFAQRVGQGPQAVRDGLAGEPAND